MYSVSFSKKAASFLKKSDKFLAERVLKRIKSACKDPKNPFNFRKLKNREEYRLRVGNYRVLARINDKDKKIFVLSIRHRRNVYKN